MNYPPLVPQKQPNLWTCYPTVVSILTGIPLAKLIDRVGHDGSREGFFTAGDWHRESFSQTEMALALLGLGYALVPVNAFEANERGEPKSKSPRLEEVVYLARSRFLRAAVVVQRQGRHHCLAWDAGYDFMIDPRTGESVTDHEGRPFGGEPVVAVELLIPLEESECHPKARTP